MYHIEVELVEDNDITRITKSCCVIYKIEEGKMIIVDGITSYNKKEVINLVEKYVPNYFNLEYQFQLKIDKLAEKRLKEMLANDGYSPKIKLRLESFEMIRKMFEDIDAQVTKGVVRYDLDYNENEILSKLIGRALKIKNIKHKDNYFDEIKSFKFYLQSPKFGILHNYYYNDILVLITEMDFMGFRYEIPLKEIFLSKKDTV